MIGAVSKQGSQKIMSEAYSSGGCSDQRCGDPACGRPEEEHELGRVREQVMRIEKQQRLTSQPSPWARRRQTREPALPMPGSAETGRSCPSELNTEPEITTGHARAPEHGRDVPRGKGTEVPPPPQG